MIFKLHLTREELAFLAVAVEEREKIITHFLSQDQETSSDPDPLPFDPDPLTPSEKSKMIGDLEDAAVIAEKIHLLISYAILIDESIKARSRAENQKRAYINYINSGKKALDHADPDLEFADPDLEIPDP